MQVSHALPASGISSSFVFDEANLIAHAGLIPALSLAEQTGLFGLIRQHLSLSGPGSASSAEKISVLLAGMLAGADSIDDMDLLRHGGTEKVLTELRAPSTLGTFLRIFTHGHVRQLDAVNSRLLLSLQSATTSAGAPLLPDADQLVYVDIDDTIRQTYGYAKQGAGYGYSKMKGLNAMIVTATTPTSASVILGARLRKGSTASTRGASKLLADGLAALKRTTNVATAADAHTPARLVIIRADSAYYNHGVVATARRVGGRFSITARTNPAVHRTISTIADDAWTPIKYTDAIWDEQEQRWVSDAEVAETTYTAFTGRRKAEHVTARLIVRRVKRLNPKAGAGQGELFKSYRYHAVFTDSPLSMLAAEKAHRAHAIVESTIAELKDNALAHLPSGKFQANAAWLMLAVIAHNLTRAFAALAGAGPPGADGHDPPEADLAPGPDRLLSPETAPARPAELALADRVRQRPRRDRTAGSTGRGRPPANLTPLHRSPARTGRDQETRSGRAGHTGRWRTPRVRHRQQRPAGAVTLSTAVDPGSVAEATRSPKGSSARRRGTTGVSPQGSNCSVTAIRLPA